MLNFYFQWVWIEPLWNWNQAIVLHKYRLSVVWIEPLWNWNSSEPGAVESGDGFELNLYGIEIVSIFPSICSVIGLNWTFMELKLRLFVDHFGHTNVWIEPLWNWNVLNSNAYRGAKPVWIEPLWNWNNIFGFIPASWSRCLNWTFMELKSVFYLDNIQLMVVWIEPLWNWNSCKMCCRKLALPGLNWTFMELKYWRMAVVTWSKRKFELNLYGIEI